jgi:hypothetical protein
MKYTCYSCGERRCGPFGIATRCQDLLSFVKQKVGIEDVARLGLQQILVSRQRKPSTPVGIEDAARLRGASNLFVEVNEY